MGEEKKAQRMSLGDAVAQGIIANETLAYFIGRTYLFCTQAGGRAGRWGVGWWGGVMWVGGGGGEENGLFL